MYSVIVERITSDGQERQIWEFATETHTTRHNNLNYTILEYYDQYRRNTRCKWVDRLWYMKYGGRQDKDRIPIERVPLPRDVEEEAKQIIFSQIKVTAQ